MSGSNCKAKMPHALLIPLPAQGHINPMMQLAWKLVSDGFLITFLNTEFNHQRITKAKKDKDMHHNSDKIRMIYVPGGLPPKLSHGKNQIQGVEIFFRDVENCLGPYVIDKVVQDINDQDEEQNVTCIIADIWTCFDKWPNAIIFRWRLSKRCLFPPLPSAASAPSLSLLAFFLPMVFQRRILFKSIFPLCRRCSLLICHGCTEVNTCFATGFAWEKKTAKIDWILFNTFYELEPGVADDLSKEMGVYPIGPLIPPEFLDGDRKISTMATPSLWENDMECLEWLEKQCEQSVIYVSFGSLAVWNSWQLEEIALGLEATQRPFLGVVRSDLMDGVTAVLPPGFLDRVRDRGCIVSWAPQLGVLSHPSIACFVTHCGWNSVQESITMGVPMLCFPYFADQFINSTYVVDVWKMGLPLKANTDGLIEKEEFRRAIERLVATEEGKAIREQTKKWTSMAKNTVKQGGLSFTKYNVFVNAVMKHVDR